MSKDKFIRIGDCVIPTSATIHSGTVIGKRFRKFLNGEFEDESKTILGDNVFVGYNCIIGNGSEVGNDSIIDDKSVLESRVKLGMKNLIIYSSQICCDAAIGDYCVIGGLIGERTKVGNNCRIFGDIVHSQLHPMNPWDEDGSEEEAVTVLDKVFIGFNSVLSGNIVVGPQAYIVAGSLITKNVPPKYIAFGWNQMVHHTEWRGRLKNSNLFK